MKDMFNGVHLTLDLTPTLVEKMVRVVTKQQYPHFDVVGFDFKVDHVTEGYGRDERTVQRFTGATVRLVNSKAEHDETSTATGDTFDEATLNQLADRFISWPLPTDVSADLCATDRNYPHSRSGTNLLTHAQAKVMIKHILQPIIKFK